MNIISTVVGSYPTHSFEAHTFNEKISESLGLFDSYKKSIIESVSAFVESDIDIICDGQVRGDMVKIFASKINGFKIEDNTSYIKGKITPAAHPISVKDFNLAFKTAKSLNKKFKLNANLEDIYNHEAKGVKGIITGPTTLIHSSIIENFYSNKENAIYDMAKALLVEAKELEKAGACAIQIDEPFISTGAEDINVSKMAVETISEELDIPVILHVCGDLKDVMSSLLKFNVDILDFEFSGMSQNIGTLKKEWKNNSDKQIGIGCINTKMESVDNIENVKQTVKDVNEIIKKDNLIIDPDCGMRMLESEISKGKLDILKEIKLEGI
ncbi:methionine synthase [Methanosphaera sp.]|uniref:methionine synthase n=1 Tax=Methanosphaera sp. TaxID=2666342 RepID=UPI0025E2A1A6|nr:methionine synthase [Methanosphaera sp.]